MLSLGWGLILVAVMTTSAAAEPIDLYARAARNYDGGEFAGAAIQYDSLLQMGYGSSEVYFNLGNAHFRSGSIGEAIWAYRSAAELSPRDLDIQANLNVARLVVRDRIEPVQPSFLRLVWLSLAELLSISEGSRLVTILWGMVWLCVAGWLWWPAGQRILRPALKLTGALWLMAALVLCAGYVESYNNVAAVIVADSTEALAEPGLGADVVFNGHAGLECVVRGTKHRYVLVELTNGRVGWIPSAHLKLVGT